MINPEQLAARYQKLNPIFQNQTSDKLSDNWIDLRGWQSLSLMIYVSGTDARATISVEGSPAGGGLSLPLSGPTGANFQPQAFREQISGAMTLPVPAIAPFVKVRLSNIARTGSWSSGEGFTVYGFPSNSPANIAPANVKPAVTLMDRTFTANASDLETRFAYFLPYNVLIVPLIIVGNNGLTTGTVNIRIASRMVALSTPGASQLVNFTPDIISFNQITSASAGTFFSKVVNNSGSGIAPSTRVDLSLAAGNSRDWFGDVVYARYDAETFAVGDSIRLVAMAFAYRV